MPVAVITFVYNESVNLPLWRSYYGAQFGERNLYVVDHGSSDGSTDDLGEINVIRVPRTEMDELPRTAFVNNLHASLLGYFDTVIYTDCDEFLVPDPARYAGLRDYVERMTTPHVNALGMDVIHILDRELPLDLAQPILGQRRYGRFCSAGCKKLISRVPLGWDPGFHSCTQAPLIDPDLYMFHLKLMDYSITMRRHAVNSTNQWSERALTANHGAHHRFDQARVLHEYFLGPLDLIRRGGLAPFSFKDEIELIMSSTRYIPPNHHIPMNITRFVEIPERFFGLL